MDGVYFVISIIAIGLVMRWLIANDKVPPDKATTGLFAMRETEIRNKPRGKHRPMILSPGHPGPEATKRRF